jgi:hypothetical protein
LLKEIAEQPDPRGDGRSLRTVARVTSAFARELNGLIVTGSALGSFIANFPQELDRCRW